MILAVLQRDFMQKLYNNCWCRVSLNSSRVDGQPLVHQVSDDFRHWYDKYENLQDGPYQFLDYQLQLHKTRQLNLVRYMISVSPDHLIHGMF